MNRLQSFIARLQEKPESVRYRIAFGTALSITGVVALGWVTALSTSGTLALKDTPAVVSDGATLAEQLSEPVSAFSNLMGAAGAAFGAQDSEAALRIIQTRMSSTLDTPAAPANAGSATSISF